MFARTIHAVDRLLALGVPADLRDCWGTSPIEAFSRLGAAGAALVAALVARGVSAEPDVHARLGDLAGLEAAAGRRRRASVRADAVMIAAVDARQHDVVAWLIARGASGHGSAAADRSRQTALHGAAWNGDRRMVDLLLAWPAPTSTRATPSTTRRRAAGRRRR